MKPIPDETEALRHCVRDLVALSTLPAVWANAAPSEIAESLVEILQRTLHVDFLYIRVNSRADGVTVEALRSHHRLQSAERAREIGQSLCAWLKLDRFEAELIPNPVGSGEVRLVVIPIGHDRNCGFLAAGSQQPGFPTETERLLLGVGANQAAIVLQRKGAEDALRRAEQTSRFLADASAAFAELTDYESTLQRIASLAVPFFADWCSVDMLEADGSVRRLAARHIDPSGARLAEELDLRYPPRSSELHGVMKALRTCEPDWAAAVPDSLLVDLAQDKEHLRLLRELALKSYICVPVCFGARTLGALTFARKSGRLYDADDLQAAVDLAHRAAVAIENASLLAALKESDRRKDEFLAILAHELRNPLAPVRHAMKILQVKGSPTPELQWAMEVIDRQVQQMTRLVDDLLDVSRITSNRIELRKERVDLSAVVNSAVEASRPLIEKWGHELTVAMPQEPVYLEADLTRLSQVLLNLLNNAAKYTDQGGHIWLKVQQDNNDVLIRVRDNGIGIPAEMLSRIFDMFSQVDRSLERSQGGLGIGLTLVKRLIQLHDGAIEVCSDGPGKGSEFVVRLPMALEVEGAQAGRGAGKNQDVTVSPQRRILVVDDNQDAADTLSMLLRVMGNEVHTAHDGMEAVEAAAAFQPEVVLLDIGLPKLNGYEAAQRIRKLDGGSDMLLIALTGWGQEEDRRRSREAGFDFHLTKPVEFTALQELLTAQSSASADGGRKLS